MVNGDEVRDARFLGRHGYDASQVDDLLCRIAVELDAGRPAGPLIANATFRLRIGFDTDAVDWFLDQLVRREDPSWWARMSADPWRDLAVANYFTRHSSGDLEDRIAEPSRRARREYKTGDRKHFGQECADAWDDFGQQPGTHMQWVRTGVMRRDLITAEQQTIASLRYGRPATVSTGGRTFTWKRVTGSSWPDLAEIVRSSRREGGHGHFFEASALRAKGINQKSGFEARAVLNLRQLLDETGTPILYTSGKHLAGEADACITFPDRRWLWFPVRSTELSNAIMTAVDQGGNMLARYQVIDMWTKRIEITVHPDQQLTDELALAIVISAPWLSSYFNRAGGGG